MCSIQMVSLTRPFAVIIFKSSGVFGIVLAIYMVYILLPDKNLKHKTIILLHNSLAPVPQDLKAPPIGSIKFWRSYWAPSTGSP